jgi:hypothetical protein
VAAGESEILKKISFLLLRSAAARATLRAMNAILKYRGREVTQAEVGFIRELIAAHPGCSRRRLSQELCRAWNWVQYNDHDVFLLGKILTLLTRESLRDVPDGTWSAQWLDTVEARPVGQEMVTSKNGILSLPTPPTAKSVVVRLQQQCWCSPDAGGRRRF